MWLRSLCLLVVVWDAAGALRVYEGERRAQESSEQDQEGSASVVSERGPGSAELRHSFGLKIEHPSSEDLQGRVVEQREHHAFGSQPPSVDQQEFQPTSHAVVGGEWKGISRFKDHQEQQQSPSHELSQHQVLSQVLQGLGQVNQILGKNHQGIEEVNQIFGKSHQEYQKQNPFPSGDRELHTLKVEKDREEHKNLYANANQDVKFDGVSNNLIENKDNTNNYDFRSELKLLQDPQFSNSPHPLGTQVVYKEHNQGLQTLTNLKELLTPYTAEVEKEVPLRVEVPVDRPHSVERPQKYPVYVEKKVPHFIPQPYTVYKRVPYKLKVHKPYPMHVPKPYHVLVENKAPYQVVEKVPYPVRLYVDKPYPGRVPQFRPLPYPVAKRVPLHEHQVSNEKFYPVPVPKPYKVYVEKKVPYAVHVPLYRQQKPSQQVEVSGQPGTTAATFELQSLHQHPRWREYVSYPVHAPTYHSHPGGQQEDLRQQVVGGSRQVETTDQGVTGDFQRYQQQPVPHPDHYKHDLGHQGVEGSRQQVPTDQGATGDLQSNQQSSHQYPPWREHLPAPAYYKHDPGQQTVEEARLPSVTADQSHASIEVQRLHPSQWREQAPRYA